MRLPQPSQRTYETADLNLASFLRCRGFHIDGIREESGRALFVFHDSPELRGAILDFANDGLVGVRSFCNTLRDLKAIARDTGSAGRRLALALSAVLLFPFAPCLAGAEAKSPPGQQRFAQEAVRVEFRLDRPAAARESRAKLPQRSGQRPMRVTA